MLRIVQNRSAAAAKSYYSRSDYLSESQELTGRWGGKGAALLGLSGDVQKQDFDRLCDNLDPRSGERLTIRTKENRTTGYDFNFHVPKGISIAYELNGDDRILAAFRAAVDETMQEIEQDAATRIRKHNGDIDRHVGNLTWAEFIHKTARPVGGVPDPHLHAHCFVMNAVWDRKEEAWKAGQFKGLKRDAPYYEAAYHARLAQNMVSLGYSVKRTNKGWDIGEIPQGIRDKFKRRTDQIEEIARRKGVESESEKAELGAKTREKKVADLGMEELRTVWRERLTDNERSALAQVAPHHLSARTVDRDLVAELASLQHSVLHSFERQSVVPERRLLAEALRHGVGQVTVQGVRDLLEQHPVMTRELDGRKMVTTHEVLAEERRMMAFSRDGKNACQPLNDAWQIQQDWLNADQKQAVLHVLSRPDRVMAIRGSAGTGKTSLMKEAVAGIEASGHEVFTFAPSAEASRGVLKSEGFNATTVAELLVSKQLQQEVHGQVLWIDEAGLLSARQLAKVFDIAAEHDCRVILSGDWKQHSSPERGSPMRLLEQQGALQPAVVRTIERQKGSYRDAVYAFSDGRTDDGMAMLDKLGWIQQIEALEERYQQLARDYAQAMEEGATALAVTPTHAEAELLTATIRRELKERGVVDKTEHEFMQLKPLRLTEAQRGDAKELTAGRVLVFHQNAKGIRRGTRMKIENQPPTELASKAKAFDVYSEQKVQFAEGDLLRITAGGSTADGKHRLNNGNVYRIKRFSDEGNIVLENGWQLAKDFGFFAPGYVSTSHASQGKTVDRVFIAESAMSFPAAGREQMYVSISRGRYAARIYTDDAVALKDAICRADERLSATELLQDDREDLEERMRAARGRAILLQQQKNERHRDYQVLYDRG